MLFYLVQRFARHLFRSVAQQTGCEVLANSQPRFSHSCGLFQRYLVICWAIVFMHPYIATAGGGAYSNWDVALFSVF